MARIRTIKPEFFTSEDIVSLSPLARLLYIAMWIESDREGRLVWKPRTFKIRYLPADSCDIDSLCRELIESGLVVLYGDAYAYIPTFTSHQHINPRESQSHLPFPDEAATRQPRVVTRQARDSDLQVGTERKGMSSDALRPDDVDKHTWEDFLKLRKAKKAPVTETVVKAARVEAGKANMSLTDFLLIWCARGSQGLQADWIKSDVRGATRADMKTPWEGAR